MISPLSSEYLRQTSNGTSRFRRLNLVLIVLHLHTASTQIMPFGSLLIYTPQQVSKEK